MRGKRSRRVVAPVPNVSTLAGCRLPSVSMRLCQVNVTMQRAARSRAQPASTTPPGPAIAAAVAALPRLQKSRQCSGGSRGSSGTSNGIVFLLPRLQCFVASRAAPQRKNSRARHLPLAARTREFALSRSTLVLLQRTRVKLHSADEKQSEDEGERKGKPAGDGRNELAAKGEKKERRRLPASTPAAQALSPVSVVRRLRER